MPLWTSETPSNLYIRGADLNPQRDDAGLRVRIALLLAGALILSLFPAACGRVDAGTGRIRLLFVGQWPYGGRPQYMIEDPLLLTSVVPYYEFGAQLEEIRRYMNLRYPRTLKHMTDSYDAVAFSNIQVLAFTPKQVQMIPDAVIQEGLGYIMCGGHTSFGGTTDSYPSWAETSLYPVLPVDVVDGLYLKTIVFKLMVRDGDNALMESLPWSDLPLFTYTLNAASVRQGAHLLADTTLPEGYPVLAYGDFGKGRTLGFLTPLNTIDNHNMRDWGFFDDMCANMVYFTAGVDLPSDPFMVHELRRRFRIYHDERLLYLSMVEFVDRFGASTRRLEDRLEGIEAVRAEAYAAYIQQDYEVSAGFMEQVLDDMKLGRAEAVDVKNAALLWVYVVEWLAVMATLMIAGSLLWTLMVRKRLYREVKLTRPGPV
jgi:uncharacterized membrane protein